MFTAIEDVADLVQSVMMLMPSTRATSFRIALVVLLRIVTESRVMMKVLVTHLRAEVPLLVESTSTELKTIYCTKDEEG